MAASMLFDKWSYGELSVPDGTLEDHIAIKDKAQVFIPHTAGRWQKQRFRKTLCPLSERLVASIMYHGRNNGKKIMAMRHVQQCLELIHIQTGGENPLQILIEAVCNAGPREDSCRVGSAGVIRLQAVDVSPMRRVNKAMYMMVKGVREQAFRNIKSFPECLADEIIAAAAKSPNSWAMKKKIETERAAQSNR